MRLCWCSEPNCQTTGRAFCQKTHFIDKTACDVNNFMRLAQEFAFRCSVLPKTLSDANGALRSCQVSVWRSRTRTASQHVWFCGCWAFPRTDRRWQPLPLGRGRGAGARVWGWALCARTAWCAGRCRLRGLKSVSEPAAVVRTHQAAAAELRHFLFGFQYFSVCWGSWGFFPHRLIGTHRSWGLRKMYLLDSVLFRADLRSYWVYRYQTIHTVTQNTCG